MTWEAIFFLAVLKIPVVYVLLVVWWAIRAEPEPGRGLQAAALRRPRRPGPARPRVPARGGPRSGEDGWRRRPRAVRRSRVPA